MSEITQMSVEELKAAYDSAVSEVDALQGKVLRLGNELGESESALSDARIAEERALCVYAEAVGIPTSRISFAGYTAGGAA